jgi:hypothetical protein
MAKELARGTQRRNPNQISSFQLQVILGFTKAAFSGPAACPLGVTPSGCRRLSGPVRVSATRTPWDRECGA